jgi:hypothetical protein
MVTDFAIKSKLPKKEQTPKHWFASFYMDLSQARQARERKIAMSSSSSKGYGTLCGLLSV